MKRAIALLACCVVFSGQAPAAPSAPEHPNVLLVYIDDMNTDIGAYGHPIVQTPNMDALGSHGVLFERAYCPYPLCNPSRVATMTGLRATTTGILSNSTFFGGHESNGVPTLPYHFRTHGYKVAGTGKIFHNSYAEPDTWDEYPAQSGYDPGVKPPTPPEAQADDTVIWYGALLNNGTNEQTNDGKSTIKALQLLETYAGQEPFFVGVGYHKPHRPFIYPPAYAYSPTVVALPVEPPDWRDGVPAVAYTNTLKLIANTDQIRKETTAAYWSCISFIDAEVGKMVAKIDELEASHPGLRDRTIVVLLSDHGWSNGEHERWGKNVLFDEAARTVFMIYVPWLTSGHGGRSLRPVEFIDLYPTLAELCNLPIPAGLEGQSLVALLQDPAAARSRPAFCVVKLGGTIGKLVRTERYVFVYWAEGQYQLYDILADPGEYDNLAGDPAHTGEVEWHLQLLRSVGLLPPSSSVREWAVCASGG